jgi:hypothetical protein
VTTEALAQCLGEMLFRVDGAISLLREILNVDGYPVLRHDSAARQVYLDRDKLNELFEVNL